MNCTKQELDKKVEWFERKLTELLNNDAKVMQITSYFKQRWTEKIVKARST